MSALRGTRRDNALFETERRGGDDLEVDGFRLCKYKLKSQWLNKCFNTL